MTEQEKPASEAMRALLETWAGLDETVETWIHAYRQAKKQTRAWLEAHPAQMNTGKDG